MARDSGPGWTTRAALNREALAAGGRQRDPRGTIERVLGTLNRRFVSSVPHQERSWDDSPERRATMLREQDRERVRRGLQRP